MSSGKSGNALSQLDTSFSFNVYDDSVEGHTSPTPVLVYSPRTPLSPSPSITGTSPNLTPTARPTNLRARNESRKLLSHVLLQLANRHKPAPIVNALTNPTHEQSERGFGAFAESFKEAVKHGIKSEKRPERRNGGQLDDSDEEDDGTFSTDNTIDLMLQLKDVLTMSISQGWQIFDDSSLWQDTPGKEDSKISSTFRRSRRISRSVGKRSRSSSPNKDQVQVPELLSLCVAILGSIVSEDCRYRVAFPRPSRPPNALQILTLNIAQFLIHTHRHDPQIISQIAFAMIPAFSTFEPQMHPRLLSFFDSSIIKTTLLNLRQFQGQAVQPTPLPSSEDPFQPVDPPIVSIQIDEVQGDNQLPRKSLTKDAAGEIQSTNNPHQSPRIYFLAFLIPPLLSAIFDCMDLQQEVDSDTMIPANLVSLLNTIADSKLDCYNDLLEIIAFRGPRSRRLAIASLAKVWPRATGHSTISSPFCSADISDTRRSRTMDDIHKHQFVLWSCDSNKNRIRMNHLLTHDDCRACLKPIQGSSLVCPFCMTAVHSDCYDYSEGNYQVQYSMANDPRTQRIAMCRFSDVQLNGDPTRGLTSIHGHQLRPTNWFTLCLCFVCKEPLWGCFMQGSRCVQCSISVHFKCISLLRSMKHCSSSLMITSTEMTIGWDELRQACMDHFPILHANKQQLSSCSHEEVSVYRDVLSTQLQLLSNGILMGSIVLPPRSRNPLRSEDGFELHRIIQHCDELLRAGSLPCSASTQQYMEDTNATSKPSILFNRSYLEYITSSIKASAPQHQTRGRSTFLNVDQPMADYESLEILSYECVTLSHIRNILDIDFALHSDLAACPLIDHLHHLSLFDRKDHSLQSFTDIAREKDVECVFPLPLGLDLSLNVETLVSSIEACLTDLDLSSNEFGFLLLTRRFWPNGLASEYGLKRLAARLLSWILDEDDKLATILREYVAKQQKLPGVRTDRNVQTWPSQTDLRPGSSGLSSNGGDFVAARRSLLSRFAVPWLLELHDLYPDLYSRIAFEACLQGADDEDVDFEPASWSPKPNMRDQAAKRCDSVLRSIIKLSHSAVLFTTFDALFLRWMELTIQTNRDEKPNPSIYRLFSSENETTQRGSTVMDFVSGQADRPSTTFVDPFRIILELAKQSAAGLCQALTFLPMAIKSGVTIQPNYFKDILVLIAPGSPNFLENAEMFTRAIALSLWLRSLGRQDFQVILGSLHSKLSKQLSDCLMTGRAVSVVLSIIRCSLASCLRIYGCERSRIITAGFISQSEVDLLPSRRKLTVRGSGVVDPVFIDPAILSALELYIQSKVEDVACLAAKFLNLFFAETPYLEGFEIDNFVLRNGKLIAVCVWAAYNIQREDIAAARTHLFLRSVLVDSEPFYEILHGCMDAAHSTLEQRLSGINRLFRIISDVTSPAFSVEGRQWRSSVIEIFFSYFSALWLDPAEEIRLAVRVSSAALLPAHFEIISQCWNESLCKAPIAERIRLLGFLIQLRPHFTSWKVLSWESMIDTLTEYDYDPRSRTSDYEKGNDTEKYDYRLSSIDPDMAYLRASILLLSLQMLADGIDVDTFSLMKIKVQLVELTGFSKVSVIPTGQSFRLQFNDIAEISESAYPCIEELVHVVDAPHYTELPYSALGIAGENEDKTASVLVGSVFLDVNLCIVSTLRDLSSLPVLTLKSVLETLYILIHKYDLDDWSFHHMQPLFRRAILRAIELLSKDISYELRQLALSIAQASIKKWHTFLGATISTILEVVATEVSAQQRNSQDALVVHGKLLIGSTLHTFCYNGLMLSLMRRPLKPDFFNVLKQVLVTGNKEANGPPPSLICDPLLRDTLTRVVDCDAGSFQTVLQNLCTFIEVVYCEGYPETLVFAGQQLTHIARRMSDGTIQGADPSPLILISVTLMENHKKQLKDILPYVDTVLRISLNRLHVDTPSLTRLIKCTVSLPHPAANDVDIINILFEILLDGLRMKTKMLPLTIKALIQALLSTEVYPLVLQSGTREHLFRDILDDAYTFLQNHAWHDDNIDDGFKAAIATATLFLNAANKDPTVFQKFTEPVLEKSPRSTLSIRSWNILLLVTLQEEKADWRTMLYSHFGAFTNVYAAMMRSYVHSGITSLSVATTDVNQAHIAIKLWLMLANSMTMVVPGGETMVAGMWNELWAAYEGFLDVLEMEAQVGQYPTLISLASTSVADLMLYMRSVKMSLAVDVLSHTTILNRLKAMNRGDSSSAKIARAIRTIAEPPSDTPGPVLLDQIAKELVAAERIRVLEAKRFGEQGKFASDRTRKDGKPVAG